MDANAKKVSITIIIVLVGVIGGLWYVGNKNNNPTIVKKEVLIATSTDLGFDLKTYLNGRTNIEQIVIDKLAEGKSTTSLQGLPTETTLITANKLIISANTSSSSLKTYGQKIAQTLAPYNSSQINETALVIEALEEKNPLKAQKLLELANSNKTIVANLLKISAPKTAATVHLNLINSLNKNATLLADMAKILDNPAAALESANLYRVQKMSFYKAVEGVNDFFKNNDIVFAPSEAINVYLTI